jgi:hypothetical protein
MARGQKIVNCAWAEETRTCVQIWHRAATSFDVVAAIRSEPHVREKDIRAVTQAVIRAMFATGRRYHPLLRTLHCSLCDQARTGETLRRYFCV